MARAGAATPSRTDASFGGPYHEIGRQVVPRAPIVDGER